MSPSPPTALLHTPRTRRESLLSAAAEAEAADAADTSPTSGCGSDTPASASSRSACERVLSGHAGWVTALAFLPDGRLLSGSADATVRVWGEEDSASETVLLEGHAGSVRALAPLHAPHPSSADAAVCFVSAGDDATLRVWRLPDSGAGAGGAAGGAASQPRCDAVLSGHGDAVYALLALRDGRVLSASADRTLRLWHARTAHSGSGGDACAAVLDGHTDFVLALSALDDAPGAGAQAQPRAVSASWDATLRVWSLGGGGGGGDGDVRAGDAPRCERALVGHAGPVRAVAALPRRRRGGAARCVSGAADGTLRLWDADSGACERVIQLAHARSGSSAQQQQQQAAPPPGVLALAPLGARRIAVASEDGSLRVWALGGAASGAAAAEAFCERSLRGHAKKVYALALSGAAPGRMASGSRDRSVRVWSLQAAAGEQQEEEEEEEETQAADAAQQPAEAALASPALQLDMAPAPPPMPQVQPAARDDGALARVATSGAVEEVQAAHDEPSPASRA
jgi:WD40 repeat protein